MNKLTAEQIRSTLSQIDSLTEKFLLHLNELLEESYGFEEEINDKKERIISAYLEIKQIAESL